MHVPVMLKEMIECLEVRSGGVYADVTYGCGGYAKAIHDLSNGKLYVSDRDERAVKLAGQYNYNIPFHGRFSDLDQVLQPESLDGLVADLGLSSTQIEDSERGFSFMRDGRLDMSMGLSDKSALDVIRNYSEEDLGAIIRDFGEEFRWRAIAKAIVRNRARVKTTRDLVHVIPKSKLRIHHATKTFQALRITVNDELNEIAFLVKKVFKWLKKGGRVVIVSFHSLEDRIVKREFKKYKSQGLVKPSVEEINQNRKSRSAKLRWCKKDDVA